MDSRSHSVLIIVLVVGLAGCSGLSPFSSDVSYPPGYNELGITNPQKALEQHASARFDHDSFTEKLHFSNPTSNTSIDVTAQITSADKRARIIYNASGSRGFIRSKVYLNNNVSYRMVETSFGGEKYNTTDQPFSTIKGNVTGVSLVQRWVKNSSFGGVEPVTRDGETLLRYNSTNVTDIDPFLPMGVFGGVIDKNFSATLLVDQDGVIRSFTYSLTYTTDGETQRLTARYRVTDLDSTFIKKPGWIEKAKSQAS